MIQYHHNIVQGTPEWFAVRCGILTASEMKLILTPGLDVANNDKTRAHVYEILSQRLTRHVEPSYVSDDMIRGQVDEIEAKAIYSEHYAKTTDCGFVTNDEWGFTIGYSPDALVGHEGLIEIKSRRQKYQAETICKGKVPEEYMIQIQTGLLVTKRRWCDFVSYCGGMPMMTIRVYPDDLYRLAIIDVAEDFEAKVAENMKLYKSRLKSEDYQLIPTERKIEQEITI